MKSIKDKAIPLNLNVLTWCAFQWISTITYIIVNVINRNNVYMYIMDKQLKHTLFSILVSIVLFVVQLYTYGAYVTNTKKDILVPTGIILAMAILEAILFGMFQKLGAVVSWGSWALKYGSHLAQCGILLIVFRYVEFVEIPVDSFKLMTGKDLNEDI